mgnify:CR=1 FL=1
MTINIDPIKCEIEVPLNVADAFKFFVTDFSKWWPSEYTWSQESLVSIAIEHHLGGRCTETGPHGFQIDWGRVLEWYPSEKLKFSWQISPNREPIPDSEKASVVAVDFEAINANTTLLVLTHDRFEKHGEGALAYRDSLASNYGWPFILNRYLEGAKP